MTVQDKKRDEYAAKNAKKRAKRKRRGLLGFFAVFLIIVICVGAVLSATILFPVRKITVAGNSSYSAEQVKNASGITPDDNIIMLSSKKVISRISKTLPLSGKITVKKIFPEAVRITVNSAVAEYCFKKDDLFYVADSELKIIKKAAEQEPDCLFLRLSSDIALELGSVIKFSEEDRQLLDMILSYCDKKNITLTGIDISQTTDLNLIVDGKFLVELGSDIDFEFKMSHLSAMLLKMDETAQGIINLKEWTSSNTQAFFRDQKINTVEFCGSNG